MEGVLGDLATLFFGLAALVTALGGATVKVVAVFRAPRKTAQRAAELAIDRALGDDDEESDGEREEIVEEILKRLRGGDPE